MGGIIFYMQGKVCKGLELEKRRVVITYIHMREDHVSGKLATKAKATYIGKLKAELAIYYYNTYY